MGSIEIFANESYFSLTMWSLVLLFLVAVYSSFNLNITKAVWYLFAGLTLEFLSAWYGYHIGYFNSAGVSINILVAIELSFSLISVVMLALAASEILIGKHRLPLILPAVLLWVWLPLFSIVSFILMAT